jgi:uncharacterized membrane protein HdeD (DUF308 family)
MTTPHIAAVPTLSPRRNASAWFIVEGILLIVLGALAAFLPAVASVAAALVFGWVLILSGIFGLVALFGSREHAHIVWSVISALVALAVGILILVFPLIGVVTLAIFIAAYLLIDAVALIGLAMDQRRRQGRGWPWLIVAGVVDIALALFILAMGPLSTALLLGYVIAIDLVVAGLALVTLGWAARRTIEA